MNKFLCILFGIFVSGAGYSADMIADITDTVHTEFGVYHPYPVDVNPACTPYAIDSGFTNVANFDSFTFTACEESLLLNNAFVSTPSARMEIYDIYNEVREREMPIFVSCDALLHTYHILYDKLLQTAEIERLVGDIENLTDTLYSKVKEEWDSASAPSVKEALQRNLAYLSVAKCLLNTTFTPLPEVETLVDTELALVYAHKGYTPSPIFECAEDYSQYVPRGHYTKSDTLERYFRAMMWYGRMTFAMRAVVAGDYVCVPDTILQTRMAVLLVHGIHNIEVAGEPGTDVWERVYLPTMFFVGKSDDIHLEQYTQIAEGVYGAGFASLPPDSFANDVLLNEFIAKANTLPDPAIPTLTPKGFRFMGQRFVPDSWMFSQLTFDRIPGERLFPRGLDVMSVLGSEHAYEILDQIYDETAYEGYPGKMSYLKAYFSALPDATWAQNLYWNWLYCLMPFTFAKGTGFPTFMQNEAWTRKELYGALGSWSELRHDTILYAKQSVSPPTGSPSESYTIHGYVEPNPWAFARLASLVKYTKEGLKELDLLYYDFEARLIGLENSLLVLKIIAEKELTNQSISYGEDRAITGIGAEIAKLVIFDEYEPYPGYDFCGLPKYPPPDDQMPVIADVHTDANLMQCLEEGVGYPFNLYVIVPLNGELTVCWGAGFSYYEFKQPISNRLTDEQWQTILQTDPPDVPIWAASFVDTSQLGAVPNPEYYYGAGFCWCIQQFGVEERELSPSVDGKSLELRVYPNPSGRGADIRFQIPDYKLQIKDMRLTVHDISGRLVRELRVESKEFRVEWNGRDSAGKQVPQGIYFINLKLGDFEKVCKFVLVR
ncbi:DUF3160 domain-containing protein [candidate division WOR-3 bacterium]|nr:DUF3160 domain-containing protein [candidate division WOR-3 bacterium]